MSTPAAPSTSESERLYSGLEVAAAAGVSYRIVDGSGQRRRWSQQEVNVARVTAQLAEMGIAVGPAASLARRLLGGRTVTLEHRSILLTVSLIDTPELTLDTLTQQILAAVGEDYFESLNTVAGLCGMTTWDTLPFFDEIHDRLNRAQALTEAPAEACHHYYGTTYRGGDLTRLIDTERGHARTQAHLLALRAPVLDLAEAL